MSGLIPTNHIDGKFRGEYVYLDKNTTEVRTIQLDRITLGQHQWRGGEVSHMYVAQADRATEVGDCGAIMVAHTPYGPITLGLHCMGSPDGIVKAAPLVAKDVEDAITYFGVPVIQCSALEL
jgi:hypothetical protein